MGTELHSYDTTNYGDARAFFTPSNMQINGNCGDNPVVIGDKLSDSAFWYYNKNADTQEITVTFKDHSGYDDINAPGSLFYYIYDVDEGYLHHTSPGVVAVIDITITVTCSFGTCANPTTCTS